ncbi:hypothetical protein D3C87_1885210 [compost metagenome]
MREVVRGHLLVGDLGRGIGQDGLGVDVRGVLDGLLEEGVVVVAVEHHGLPENRGDRLVDVEVHLEIKVGHSESPSYLC